jgi:hypothetical protein
MVFLPSEIWRQISLSFHVDFERFTDRSFEDQTDSDSDSDNYNQTTDFKEIVYVHDDGLFVEEIIVQKALYQLCLVNKYISCACTESLYSNPIVRSEFSLRSFIRTLSQTRSKSRAFFSVNRTDHDLNEGGLGRYVKSLGRISFITTTLGNNLNWLKLLSECIPCHILELPRGFLSFHSVTEDSNHRSSSDSQQKKLERHSKIFMQNIPIIAKYRESLQSICILNENKNAILALSSYLHQNPLPHRPSHPSQPSPNVTKVGISYLF